MSVANFLEAFPTRAFYLVDTGLGWLAGAHCPNCDARGEKVVHKHLWVDVRRCVRCGLLYRPTGFRDGRALAFYYSALYRNAGVATDTKVIDNPEELSKMIASEGKDRSEQVRSVADEHQLKNPRVCVLGCSWGYELVRLKAAGFDVVGIELSTPRREMARNRLGLEVVADETELKGQVDIVMSSHVLEHIPRVSERLQAIDERLRPRVHIHTTPLVEDSIVEMRSVVGREHPLGITSDFWKHYTEQQGFQRYRVEKFPGEMTAILTR